MSFRLVRTITKSEKKQRNVVTSKIRIAKRDCNFKKLGPNASSRTINKNLKNHLSTNQKQPKVPDIENLNEYVATSGSVLSTKVPLHHEPVNVQKIVKTIVLSHTNETEVSKIIQTLKNKNVMVMMALATK